MKIKKCDHCWHPLDNWTFTKGYSSKKCCHCGTTKTKDMYEGHGPYHPKRNTHPYITWTNPTYFPEDKYFTYTDSSD